MELNMNWVNINYSYNVISYSIWWNYYIWMQFAALACIFALHSGDAISHYRDIGGGTFGRELVIICVTYLGGGSYNNLL